METKTNKTSKKPKELTDWDWTTLVAAWRYYEYRTTIASASFPEDIVSRFFTGAYSKKACDTIAHQFAIVDHGLRGEEDWTKDKTLRECDVVPWTKFYRFCKGWTEGFSKVTLIDGKCNRVVVEAFHVDATKRWYPVKEYITKPFLEIYCEPVYVKETT